MTNQEKENTHEKREKFGATDMGFIKGRQSKTKAFHNADDF